MKVKICGVCRAADAAVVSEAGADFIGVILAPGSRRTLSLETARDVFGSAGRVSRVGVFADASFDAIVHAVSHLGLDVVQLHGSEPPEDVTRLRRVASVWKAVRVRTPAELAWAAATYPMADALLLDAWHPTQAGGTGTALDWNALVADRDRLPDAMTMVLAGGLNPDNVAVAARILRPHVVDVSSGVETAPGIKSVEKIQAFIAAARSAHASQKES